MKGKTWIAWLLTLCLLAMSGAALADAQWAEDVYKRQAYTRGFLRAQDPHGQEAVRRAREAAGLSDLRARNVQTRSGG